MVRERVGCAAYIKIALGFFEKTYAIFILEKVGCAAYIKIA